jgi:hypothetical protein
MWLNEVVGNRKAFIKWRGAEIYGKSALPSSFERPVKFPSNQLASIKAIANNGQKYLCNSEVFFELVPLAQSILSAPSVHCAIAIFCMMSNISRS